MEKEEEVKFGRSVIVPSVQELAKEPITQIPSRYVIRSENDDQLHQSSLSSIPIIDLHKLLYHHDSTHSELQKLHIACKEWGFFQVFFALFSFIDGLVDNS